jgi:outer membrane immunogenic protein
LTEQKAIMTKTFVASYVVLGLLMGTSAVAADVDIPAAYDWSGIYVSGAGGFGNSNIDWVYDAPPVRATSVNGDNNIVFGGAIGYQKQFDEHFLLGLEGGLLANLPGGNGDCFDITYTCKVDKTTALYIGPKFGYTANRFLFNIMGGYAGGKIKDFEVTKATGVVGFPAFEWQNGWFVGAGADYAFTENLIFGVNYKHVDLGKENHVPSPFNATETRDISVSEDVITANITFKFNR